MNTLLLIAAVQAQQDRTERIGDDSNKNIRQQPEEHREALCEIFILNLLGRIGDDLHRDLTGKVFFTEHKAPNGVVYQTAPTIACRHAFTTRIGGVSTGAQAGLNLSVNRDPELAHVLENYRLLGEATGIDTGRMAVTKQVHGDIVRTVTQTDRHTLGTPVPYEADGLVTNTPGLALICYTVIKLCTGKAKEVSALTYILSLIFLVKFFAAI